MNKMTKEELLQKIRELSFAKTETELFLDAAPDNKLALDYFHKTLDALIAELAPPPPRNDGEGEADGGAAAGGGFLFDLKL